jgi:chemotaxis protein methyltransferase CheR
MNNHLLSPRQFSRVSTFIQTNFGINLPPSKKVMVSARLQKRMRHVGFGSMDTYINYVFSPKGKTCELIHMIDSLTTNKTGFFREATHFESLCDKILPLLHTEKRLGVNQKLRVWSSACSTGEEPYTIAMTLNEFSKHQPKLRFSIVASDISTKVLKKASQGIYQEEQISKLPMLLRKSYLLRSKDRALELVQFKENIRNSIAFRRINLMDDTFGIKEKMHVIFCRNVLIYFDKKTQQALMHRFAKQLLPGGFLFIGHSESLTGMDVPFEQFMPTIYRKSELGI